MIKNVYNILSVVIGIVFLFGIFKYSADYKQVDLLHEITAIGWWKISLSAFLYLLSHLLRSFRIAILLNMSNLSLKAIIEKQFYTNGVNLIIPFRLGEIYRMYSFNEIVDNYQTSVITILTERALDFFILFIGLISTIFITQVDLASLNTPLVIAFIFILSALFIYYVLPENIRSFNLYVAKRYNTRNTIRVLAFTGKFYEIIFELKNIIKQKVTTLLVLTAIIWLFEIAGFLFLINVLPFKLIFLLAFLVFLSAFIPSGAFNYGGIQLGFGLINIIQKDFNWFDYSLIYQIFMFTPAMIISLILYIKSRLQNQKKYKKYYV